MSQILQSDMRQLLSIWDSLLPNERKQFLELNADAAPIVDALVFLRTSTRTRDDKDPANPYKPFPNWPCFDVLHDYFLREPVICVEKSRTMLATWFGAGECLHYVMTHQPASCIFWCPDQDRAEQCTEYAWVLHEQMQPWLKALYPLDRPRNRQAKYRVELKHGGWLEALPGKDPDKIRSAHPTIVMMDEACFNEEGAEAFDNAVSTKPLKLLVVSSAAPSWFRDLTEVAMPEAIQLPEALRV